MRGKSIAKIVAMSAHQKIWITLQITVNDTRAELPNENS